jgi:hypothetical protein
MAKARMSHQMVTSNFPTGRMGDQHRRRTMTAHVLTRAELQAWVDVLSDDEERKAMQAKLDTDPDWVRNKIEKAMQAAFDRAVEEGVLTPKGLNERGQKIYRSNIYRARHG